MEMYDLTLRVYSQAYKKQSVLLRNYRFMNLHQTGNTANTGY